jgi:hypothetical protein
MVLIYWTQTHIVGLWRKNTQIVLLASKEAGVDVHAGEAIMYYRGPDKSLARPDKKKKQLKVRHFRPTQKSLLSRKPGWTDKFLIFF